MLTFTKSMLALSVMAAVAGANAATYTEDTTRECQDFCVWGGYSRGSPTRLPFVFEMQYARPDAIAREV